jgi:SAM-dependent methyltransferase
VFGSVIRRAAKVPIFAAVLDRPAVRARLHKVRGFSNLYAQGWLFAHPFDRFYGIDTSGFVPAEELASSPFDGGKPGFYAGSQPSIIRTALATLTALEPFTFVDLGCGKGRPLIVASEFPFRDIVGIELSESLARAARTQASIQRRRVPAPRSCRMPARIRIPTATSWFSSTTPSRKWWF